MLLIAIVATSKTTAARLKSLFEIERYLVRAQPDPARGIALARSGAPDLVILESASSSATCLVALRAIRESNEATPVLVIGVRGNEHDRLRLLRSGADDYIAMPVDAEELLLRVSVLLRRAWRGSSSSAADRSILQITRRVAIDLRRRSVTRDGIDVELTPRQYDLFTALAAHNGDVVPRERLAEDVWGGVHQISMRVLNWHVQALRRRIENDSTLPALVLTVRRTGYRLAVEHAAPVSVPRVRAVAGVRAES
jgi:DNA-binding response OmpR family regulator